MVLYIGLYNFVVNKKDIDIPWVNKIKPKTRYKEKTMKTYSDGRRDMNGRRASRANHFESNFHHLFTISIGFLYNLFHSHIGNLVSEGKWWIYSLLVICRIKSKDPNLVQRCKLWPLFLWLQSPHLGGVFSVESLKLSQILDMPTRLDPPDPLQIGGSSNLTCIKESIFFYYILLSIRV